MESPNKVGGNEADDERMEYEDPEIEKIVREVEIAVAEGRTRRATKLEILKIRYAALRAMMRNMEAEIEKEMENEKIGEAYGKTDKRRKV